MQALSPMEGWAVSELSCWPLPSVMLWLQHLILITFQRESGSTAGFWSKLFPSRSWCTDISELSGKKHIGSDSKCSRWGWSFPLCRLVLHRTITVWSLHLKPPHTHRQMTRTLGSAAFWLSPWCYCKFLGFFPEESEKHLWNLRVLWDGKGISSLIAGWTSPCYFLKHILRNCVLWGLGLKSCTYCCRQLMLQLSIQLSGHCGVYDNARKC